MPPSNWSILNWGSLAPVNLLATIPNTIQSAHPVEPSGLDLYLVDPPTSIGVTDFGNFDDVPLDIFQARLALIFNTFYQASLNTSNILGADGVDGVAPQNIPEFDQKQYTNTTGTWNEFTPSRYEVQYSWFALYFAATTVLAICAVTTVVISALTRAPDLFGGVSSLTRDSAFMTTVPDGGSLLSGSERARLLQDVWVRIQDVQPEDDVGRIAFSDQKELGAAAALRWERKYE
ncbi:hypothetical protein DIS24_g9622 [Lasiodiplodia hormozganensis]|uniref:Uncharacterized protein n=2 Tax=Lasiodiplodia TaxID=66739 RepID=A0A5N5D4I9_9PEZI|nr:hypothetical protein DBV05_g8728 [Lasiodiplodia theobromae]KAK0640155.1 hypothetical protein DIS24_g9622 [Lasiodiplodia hormozganensis]